MITERRLVVEAGGPPGTVIRVPRAVAVIGRDQDADLRIPLDGVSRRHAILDATGSTVRLADAGSLNGTWVNGARVTGSIELRDGDTLAMGGVRLRFYDPTSPIGPGASPSGDDVRVWADRANIRGQQINSGNTLDVNGNLTNSGNIAASDQNISYGHTYAAGRDQNWSQKVKVSNDYNPWDELFSGRGPGRAVAIVGALISLAGFGFWMWTIFTLGADQQYDPQGFPPQAMVAFFAFLGGGVLVAIGTGMSKASRKRRR
jgi:pSer/pThr/pTyr-binding forkhead associated (FHA) protein